MLETEENKHKDAGATSAGASVDGTAVCANATDAIAGCAGAADATNGANAPLISVVVPVYKVENYLDRCVESLLAQTYQNLEIILVDDGSPDSCPALCDEWGKRDERIVVIHKPNGGLSDARNAGVLAAHGDYIGFVDSDDYVAPDMYESLYAHLIEAGADVSICGIADVYFDHTENPNEIIRTTMTSQEVLSDMLLNKTLTVCVPPRLYPAWLLHKVPQPVGMTHEDSWTVVDFFTKVNKVAVDTTPRYFYWHAEGTITSNPATRARQDLIDAWEHNRHVIEKHFPQIIDDVMFRCYWAHFDVLDGMILSNSPDKKRKQDIIAWLKQHKKGILKHPEVNAKRKIALRALCLSEKLYEKLVFAQNSTVKYNEAGAKEAVQGAVPANAIPAADASKGEAAAASTEKAGVRE